MNNINLLTKKEGTCVMCGEEAIYINPDGNVVKFLAEANYKSGTVKELLCEKCNQINNQIKNSK